MRPLVHNNEGADERHMGN